MPVSYVGCTMHTGKVEIRVVLGADSLELDIVDRKENMHILIYNFYHSFFRHDFAPRLKYAFLCVGPPYSQLQCCIVADTSQLLLCRFGDGDRKSFFVLSFFPGTNDKRRPL